jgi:hypothetical protein
MRERVVKRHNSSSSSRDDNEGDVGDNGDGNKSKEFLSVSVTFQL